MSGALQAAFQNQRSFNTPPGQNAYTTAGTYSWVAPTGVTKVSVVAISAGAAGTCTFCYYSCAEAATVYASGRQGAGGGLGYLNNITVVPANSYTVVISASSGSNIYFVATTTVGAKNATVGVSSENGTYSVEGVGTGTSATIYSGGTNNQGYYNASGNPYGTTGGSGNGAAGYAGNGGDGGTTPTAGSGGGGGGGKMYPSLTYGPGAGGGGVGELGQGANGAAATTAGNGGGGGSGGTSGGGAAGTKAGGTYGGGGGAGGGYVSAGGAGGGGIVRIIWPGCARSFPSTRTANE